MVSWHDFPLSPETRKSLLGRKDVAYSVFLSLQLTFSFFVSYQPANCEKDPNKSTKKKNIGIHQHAIFYGMGLL